MKINNISEDSILIENKTTHNQKELPKSAPPEKNQDSESLISLLRLKRLNEKV